VVNKINLFKNKDGVIYQHPERSCDQCLKYPCISNMNKFKCNFAKFGCKNYTE